MPDYALVVGVEEFKTEAALSLMGPGLNALRFALWLRESQNLPPQNVSLIINKTTWSDAHATEYEQVANRVEKAGITVLGEPTYSRIMRAWHENILSGPEADGTVWLYWSGHGLTFPYDRQVVLCSDLDEDGDPSFIFLSEFRESLRSRTYKRFSQQRIVVDACAEYLTPEQFDMQKWRNPKTWRVTETPEQVEFDAVAVGKVAQAEQGGSLFSRVLFSELKKSGWPVHPSDLQKALDEAIYSETGDKNKFTRVIVRSPRYEGGIELGNHANECKALLEMMWKCKIPFEGYQPAYMRTMGGRTSDPQVLAASSLTDMVRELLELKREEFGGHSLALIEFFERVRREFKVNASPIAKWLESIPPGASADVNQKLDKEAFDLVLTILVKESKEDQHGFPVSIHADLSDANFSNVVLSWDFPNLPDRATLEKQARLILIAADAQTRRQKGINLRVQVFANPPLMGVPWHALPVDPDDLIDCAVFGQLHPFVLRSRARLDRAAKYDLAGWKQKATALRQVRCSDINFEPAPKWSDETREEVNDVLAKVNGLLLLSDPLDAPSDSTAGLYKLLNAALRRGVPLASWLILIPGIKQKAGPEFAEGLKKLFRQCVSLDQTLTFFRDARRSESWARQTVLFWDDDDTDKLSHLIGEEPTQL